MAALLGEAAPVAELPEEAILIADELLPSELMSLPRERLSGLATSGGGATSHMALIAASFGIPTLVAMGPELSCVAEGARVLLDATSGVLVIEPDEKAEVWPDLLKIWPAWTSYTERSGRDLRVFRLDRRGQSS